jgi:hypothetical protein
VVAVVALIKELVAVLVVFAHQLLGNLLVAVEVLKAHLQQS